MVSNIRILEGKSLIWDDITKAYRKTVMSEDYIDMHTLDLDRLTKLASTKPFFSECYIIELHVAKMNSKLLNQIWKYMQVEWLRFILICTKKDDYDMLESICKKGFNGYKISYKFWHSYVLARLGGKEPQCNLENIYKAMAGRYELTDVIIDIVRKTRGTCTVKQVNQIIGKKDRLSLDLLWFNILKRDERSRKDVFKYLEEYRYGYNFISQKLNEKYTELLKFYKDFHDGKLNERNMKEYRKDTHLSEWLLQSYIDVFSTISFEEIQLVGEIIQCSKISSTADMFALFGKLYTRGIYSGQ